VLSTSGDALHAEARQLLAEELPSLGATCAQNIDALGWPAQATNLDLGAQQLSRVRLASHGERKQQALLLSREGQAPHIVFTPLGVEELPAETLALLPAHALFAPAQDAAQTLAQRAGPDSATPDLQLDAAQLAEFVAKYPDALLIDVREPYEQFLTNNLELAGLGPRQAVPLSRLLNALPDWLAAPRPLLLYCRSGNRSRQAAQALARLGHTQAWSLSGGLALLPAHAAVGAALSDPALMV